MELSDLRRDFGKHKLESEKLPPDPVELLKMWLNEAHEKNIREFNAMVLSTVGIDLQPSSRIVLLKEINANGALVFFTNYHSRKGKEIANNAHVALNFFWQDLERQVRVEGIARKTSRGSSEAYFNTRPLESRISAMVSPQSKKIENLEILRQKAAQVSTDEVRIPDNWGGYEIRPAYFEFWQGGSNRLHDRICYTLENDQWIKERLAP